MTDTKRDPGDVLAKWDATLRDFGPHDFDKDRRLNYIAHDLAAALRSTLDRLRDTLAAFDSCNRARKAAEDRVDYLRAEGYAKGERYYAWIQPQVESLIASEERLTGQLALERVLTEQFKAERDQLRAEVEQVSADWETMKRLAVIRLEEITALEAQLARAVDCLKWYAGHEVSDPTNCERARECLKDIED